MQNLSSAAHADATPEVDDKPLVHTRAILDGAAKIARLIHDLAHRDPTDLVQLAGDALQLRRRDRRFHARIRAQLSAEGFQEIGWFHSRGDEGAPVQALYSDASGQIAACVSVIQAKLKLSLRERLLLWAQGKLPKARFYLAFGTRFSDDWNVETSNGGDGNVFTQP